MKVFMFTVLVLASIQSQGASMDVCQNFVTAGLQNKCIKAVGENKSASNEIIFQCSTFRTVGIQETCLQVVRRTRAITAKELNSCHAVNIVDWQKKCLNYLCKDRNIFGNCK